jgi:hypothetical protein
LVAGGLSPWCRPAASTSGLTECCDWAFQGKLISKTASEIAKIRVAKKAGLESQNYCKNECLGSYQGLGLLEMFEYFTALHHRAPYDAIEGFWLI